MTATEQTAGRGRQGRRWEAPAGRALLMSVVLRDPPAPLPLLAAVAVCDVAGPDARVKWPNDIVVWPSDIVAWPDDVVVSGRDGKRAAKLAGILTEGRPQDGWAVLGIGMNIAVRVEDLPAELRDRAATLGRPSEEIESTLSLLLVALERRFADPVEVTLDVWRERDALRSREIAWAEGGEQHRGRAEGIDSGGRLLVALPDGTRTALDAGEVHLTTCGVSSQPGGAS